MYSLRDSRLGQRKVSDVTVAGPLVREALSLVNQITKGSVEFDMTERFAKSELGPSFLAMQNYIRSIFEQEKEREWLNSGVARMNELCRSTGEEAMASLLNRALVEIVRRVDAFQGSIFSVVSAESESFLERVATYASEWQKRSSSRLPTGVGLIGQCILEKASLYLTDLPDGYLKISSGLGECKPGSLLIVPLVCRDESIGAIELAFLKPIKTHQQELVAKCAAIIASVVMDQSEKEQMRMLLALAQKQASELQEKEELMRQNLDEMQAMQEQLERNELDLKEKLTALELELESERRNEISRIREEEKMLLESKLETQKKSYEMIIERLRQKIQKQQLN